VVGGLGLGVMLALLLESLLPRRRMSVTWLEAPRGLPEAPPRSLPDQADPRSDAGGLPRSAAAGRVPREW
jgi:hypothetical protein